MSETSPTKPVPNPDQRAVLLVCALLALIVFATLGQTIRYGFINFDDEEYFIFNPHVKTGLSWQNLQWAFQIGYAANWHPLTWISLMLDAQLFGPGPAGLHLTNVVLHAANAILLFLLVRRLTGALWPGAFVAMLFAIHPLHVESVAWISERKDVLSGLFFMLALLMYVSYTQSKSQCSDRKKSFYFLSLSFFALGLMSKSMLVTLPFVLLLLDYWPLNRLSFSMSANWQKNIAILILEKLPFMALSIISSIITMMAQHEAIIPSTALPLADRLINALISYALYLRQMIYPVKLAIFYPHLEQPPWYRILLSLVCLAGITMVAFVLRRTRPYLLVGWLWYLGMLVPVIGLVQVGGQARADRYTYLPLIGIFMMITWVTNDLWPVGRLQRRALRMVACGIIAILAVATVNQSSYWRTSEVLWSHALDCTHQNYVAHNNLGSVLAKQGRAAEAIVQYQATLDINPDYAPAHNNLGILLAGKDENDEAIKHYRRAIEIFPKFAEAYNNLANALTMEGRTEDAFGYYQQAIQIQPDLGEAFNGLGNLYLSQGKTTKALEYFQKAAAIIPDNPDVQNNLGSVMADQGQPAAAIPYFLNAIALKPDFAKAHYNIASVYDTRGELDEAGQHYRRTLELMPDFTHARYQYALLLQRQGKFTAAAEQFQTILNQDPKHAPALNNLAWLLAACPDETVRDGQRAVKLAEDAEQLSGGKSPEILDTLAAAYAEAGNFPQAVETIKNAIKLALFQKQDSLASSLQSRLMLYQVKLPYRDTGLAEGTIAKP